jgi:hypothetical protein
VAIPRSEINLSIRISKIPHGNILPQIYIFVNSKNIILKNIKELFNIAAADREALVRWKSLDFSTGKLSTADKREWAK